MNNKIRIGNFTSSEVVALMSKDRSGKGPGKPYFSYIEEKNMERKLGRACNDISAHVARALTWGTLLQSRVFHLLGEPYQECDETLIHPTIDCWVGTPDGFNTNDEKAVVEVKCPMTLKSFCTLVNAWEKGGIEAIRDKHDSGEKYFWQCISNAVLTNSRYAELIVYCPKKSELEAIKELASSAAEIGLDTKWIYWAPENELPFIPDSSTYNSMNKMRFEVTYAMKAALHVTIQNAAKELIERPVLQPA